GVESSLSTCASRPSTPLEGTPPSIDAPGRPGARPVSQRADGLLLVPPPDPPAAPAAPLEWERIGPAGTCEPARDRSENSGRKRVVSKARGITTTSWCDDNGWCGSGQARQHPCVPTHG